MGPVGLLNYFNIVGNNFYSIKCATHFVALTEIKPECKYWSLKNLYFHGDETICKHKYKMDARAGE